MPTEGRCEGGGEGREVKITPQKEETMLFKMVPSENGYLKKWSHREPNRKPGYEKVPSVDVCNLSV